METIESINTKEILSSLHWRYATKKFDTDQKLDQDQVETLLETIRLSASSMGLQPYEFIHVKDPEVRERLKEHSFGQTQITDASELIVFAAKTNLDEDYIKEFARREGELRNRSEEQIQRKIKSTREYVNGMNDAELMSWTGRQAYIAIGNLLTVAALLRIDACPMEGIKGEEYDRILQLDDVNLRSLAVVTLGFRSSEDSYASQQKFRFPKDKIIKTI